MKPRPRSMAIQPQESHTLPAQKQETYVVLFTVRSWREFQTHGSSVMGFNESKKTLVSKLQKGDRLLCYLTKASVFVAQLEVAGSASIATDRIWSDGLFPVRLPVRVEFELPLSRALPIRDFAGKLSFLPKHFNSTGWTAYVRSSPRRWPTKDSAVVARRLQRAHANYQKTHTRHSRGGAGPADAESLWVARLPDSLRVGRVVNRTITLNSQTTDALGAHESVLSYNKVTGYSVNFPIALTCSPTAVCAKTCYFAFGGPSWSPAIQRQIRAYRAVCADPRNFAERVAREYDEQRLTFLRWNGGGDLFKESVAAINYLSAVRPDIILWVVTRSPRWAAKICGS
jgi:hypothetical protein